MKTQTEVTPIKEVSRIELIALIALLHESANLIARIKTTGANYPLVKRIHEAISRSTAEEGK